MRGWLAITCLLFLTGCVTATGLNSPEAEEAKKIISSKCILASKDVTSMRGTQKVGNILVYNIDHGDEDWIRVDASTKGMRSNVYYNKRLDQVICGVTTWRSLRMDNHIRFAP